MCIQFSRRLRALFSPVLMASCFAGCLAGCSQPNLLWHGIGETAYVSGETEKRLESAALYFNSMCRRAGLATVVGPNGQPRCRAEIHNQDAWELIILASMNDIDERCGAYLTQIDEARRNQAYYTRKLSNITSTTNTILPLTNPGQRALDVVGLIFGYSQESLENYYSRLILETEKGVVERIVTRLQNAYREKLEKKLAELRRGSQELDGISGAYYAVRGYLRLCLPATIESEIGSLLESVSYAGTARAAMPKDIAMLASVDAIPTIKAVPSAPDNTRPVPPPPPKLPSNTDLRTKLCITISAASLAAGDAEATAAIREFRAAIGDDPKNTNPLTEAEMSVIAASKSLCDGKPYLSVFEKFAFPPDRIEVLNERLLTALRKEVPNQVVSIKDKRKLGPDTRQAISVLRKKFSPQDARTYVDWDFYDRIITGRSRQ